MKKYMYTNMLLVMISVFSCSTDDNLIKEDLLSEMLFGQWEIGTEGSVLIDGEDMSLNYTGLRLILSDQVYTTSNGGKLFRASGTWTWSSNGPAPIIILGEGKEMTFRFIDRNRLLLRFYQNSASRSGVNGAYELIFVR